MITDLVLGLPGDRPGGLVASLGFFVISGAAAVLSGVAYAVVCTSSRAVGGVLQLASAAVRGVPVLLLVLLAAAVTPGPVELAAVVGLVAYSWSHTGEILRGFFAAYPARLREQARVMGLPPVREVLTLRVPWTIRSARDALLTHWVSLLKDTGALVVLGVGELTTLARTLSETAATTTEWLAVIASASGLYLLATLALVVVVTRARSVAPV